MSLTLTGYKPGDANSFALSQIPMPESVAASAVYLHGLFFNSPSRIDPSMWSLEIEMKSYLVFSFIILAYASISRQRRPFYGACLIIFDNRTGEYFRWNIWI